MTPEEEIKFLKGRVDALSQICSFLVATHAIGDNFANMFKNRATKELNQSDLTTNEQLYVKGYASVVADIESGQETVKSADAMRSLKTDIAH